MRRVLLWVNIVLLFIATMGTCYAVPVPIFYVWYEVLYFLIPFILSLSGTLFFFFKKRLNVINMGLICLSILLYIFHFAFTRTTILWVFEVFFMWGVLLLSLLSFHKWLLIKTLVFVLSVPILLVNINSTINVGHFLRSYQDIEWSLSTYWIETNIDSIKDSQIILSLQGESMAKLVIVRNKSGCLLHYRYDCVYFVQWWKTKEADIVTKTILEKNEYQ